MRLVKNLFGFTLDYERMPKFLGAYRTTARSYVRLWFSGKHVLTFNVPKYGRTR